MSQVTPKVSPVSTGEIDLLTHQINALYSMPKMEQAGKGGVLAFEPGLGKTITVAAHLKHMKEMYKAENTKPKCDLIVVPVAVLTHWKTEILSIYSDEDQPKILIYHGSNRVMNDIRKKWDFIITTYDMLKSTVDGVYEINKTFERIVLDEAHNIKNGSKNKCPAIATAAFEFAGRSKYRWCVTGTPFNNSIMDLASLAMFIGTKGYTKPKDWKDGVIDINGWREKYVIIKRKDELMQKPIHHDVLVTPTKKEAELAEALRDVAGKQFEKWMNAEKQDKIKHQGTLLGLVIKMRQTSDSYHIIGDQYKTISAAKLYNRSAKVQKTVEIINNKLYGDDPDPSNGIVVFSQFTRYLNLLEKVIEDQLPDVDIYMYTGSTSRNDRDCIIDEFTQDDRPRVLLISLFAGGVGLNLKPCATIMLSEPWYNPFIETQAEDRVRRLGQNNQVNLYRLTMESSVEKWVQGIKMKKLTKAAEVGMIDGLPKKGMGGISSTFKMEDLAQLFNEYVGRKQDGQLINPKSYNEEGKSSISSVREPALTREEFENMMNEQFGEEEWSVQENPKKNKEYFGGGCIHASLILEDFLVFADENEMTYINSIKKRKGDLSKIDVSLQLLPGRSGKIQIWYEIHDSKSKGVKMAKLKKTEWKRVNVYLKDWSEEE